MFLIPNYKAFPARVILKPFFLILKMPTSLRIGAYRFYFYSYDCNEPRHTHVDRDENMAKFWLDPRRSSGRKLWL